MHSCDFINNAAQYQVSYCKLLNINNNIFQKHYFTKQFHQAASFC